MNKWPTVSVIICTHNRPAPLSRALYSVLNQTYQDYEVIVVHDGPPSEDTKKVCEDMASMFDKLGINFAFMSTDESSGYYCVPRNLAITTAMGDYIAHLDDDNAWYPNTLELYVSAMEEGTVWPDFVYGRIRYLIESGSKTVANYRTLAIGPSGHQPWDEVALFRLKTGPSCNFIDTSSFMASKGAYWRLYLATFNMFNEGWRRYGDWELVTRGVYYAGWRGKDINEIVLDYYWGTPGQIQLTRPQNESVGKRSVDGV